MSVTRTKITIYGVGAVGGLIGAQLARMGCDVSAVARGDTLQALRKHGLRVQSGDDVTSVPIQAVEDPAQLGVQEVIVIAVKATALADIATKIAPLLGEHTVVIPAMNGVPWWFFENADVPFSGIRLQATDPHGEIAQAIPVKHVLGCVVHLSSDCPEPGWVRRGFGNRLILGEPNGVPSHRLNKVGVLLRDAGFDVELSNAIRTEVWYKLWGNMTMNPVSAITGATADRILDDPLVARFCLDAMAEAAEIGARVGCPITQSGEDRMAVTRKLGAFKTSMLLDAQAGKMLEIDALVTAVHEIGQRVGVTTPNIDALLGLTRLYGRTRGLYS